MKYFFLFACCATACLMGDLQDDIRRDDIRRQQRLDDQRNDDIERQRRLDDIRRQDQYNQDVRRDEVRM